MNDVGKPYNILLCIKITITVKLLIILYKEAKFPENHYKLHRNTSYYIVTCTKYVCLPTIRWKKSSTALSRGKEPSEQVALFQVESEHLTTPSPYHQPSIDYVYLHRIFLRINIWKKIPLNYFQKLSCESKVICSGSLLFLFGKVFSCL